MNGIPPPASSPLSRLEQQERQQVISAIRKRLQPQDADDVLAALAGSDAEVAALPGPARKAAHVAILDELQPGVNAIVASEMGIVDVPIESWLPQLRARHEGMAVEEVAAVYRQRRSHV